MRSGYAALASLLLLAGCATVPQPRSTLPPADEQALLLGLTSFALDGRAAVAANGDGFNASVAWRQAGTETIVKLSGPIGGSLTLTYRPGFLRVANSRGQVLQDADAEAAVIEQLGFVPPFEALRYWVLGLPAPGEAPTERIDAAGRIAQLTQAQWQIRFERWVPVAAGSGEVQLPQRLTATREGVRLRVFVDKWRL
ncbi:MAG: lipoprotein insertase outer membrane protein LolB [Steroidobacteraceae bacterium]